MDPATISMSDPQPEEDAEPGILPIDEDGEYDTDDDAGVDDEKETP